MRCHRPFCRNTSLAAAAVAALVLLTPAQVVPVRAQAAQQATLSDITKSDITKSDSARPPASQTTGAGNVAAVDQANPARQKSLTSKAIEKVKEVAKSAGDIFGRVPCLPPKGGAKSMGSLPHVASKLASGESVVIVAFGSSSTVGYGTTSPEFTYPNRLAAQLRRQYPTADITVINRGQGGEDAPEMMKRLQTAVLDMKPDLVIWQVGTNAVLRNLDPAETAKLVEEGVKRIQAAGADLVLVDPQYSPKVNERAESANQMVKLLGDDIIKSVGQIKLGVNVPSNVQTYRPM